MLILALHLTVLHSKLCCRLPFLTDVQLRCSFVNSRRCRDCLWKSVKVMSLRVIFVLTNLTTSKKTRIRATKAHSSAQQTPCLLVTRWFIACSRVTSFRALICHYYCASDNLTTILHWMRKLVNNLCIILLSWPSAVGSPYITLHYIMSR